MKRTALPIGLGVVAYLLWLRPEWSAEEGEARRRGSRFHTNYE